MAAEFAYFIYDAICFVETFARFYKFEVLTALFNLHHGYAPGFIHAGFTLAESVKRYMVVVGPEAFRSIIKACVFSIFRREIAMFNILGFTEATRFLVVSAHPDDEILACRSTLVHALDADVKVPVFFLGEGVSARIPCDVYGSKQGREETLHRQAEAKYSPGNLGVSV